MSAMADNNNIENGEAEKVEEENRPDTEGDTAGNIEETAISNEEVGGSQNGKIPTEEESWDSTEVESHDTDMGYLEIRNDGDEEDVARGNNEEYPENVEIQEKGNEGEYPEYMETWEKGSEEEYPENVEIQEKEDEGEYPEEEGDEVQYSEDVEVDETEDEEIAGYMTKLLDKLEMEVREEYAKSKVQKDETWDDVEIQRNSKDESAIYHSSYSGNVSEEIPSRASSRREDGEEKIEYSEEKLGRLQDDDHQKKTFPNLALNISWSFGYNKNIPVQNLTDDNRSMVVYASSHISVMYDYVSSRQWILQGHANSITCIYVSQNKKWLVTADKGKDSAVVIWDTYSCLPVQTLFGASADGMTAIALTPDSKYLATLSAGEFQEFSIWDWTLNGEKPLISITLTPAYGVQNYIYFNPEDYNQIVTNSESAVIFYQLILRSSNAELKWFCPQLTDKDFNVQIGKYSQSIFQYMRNRALTATSLGNLVIWETKASRTEGQTTCLADKKPLKIIKLVSSGINVLSVMYNNIVTGDMEGRVSFFNQKLMLLHRYSNFELGPVNFISFCPISKNIKHPEKYPRSCTLSGEPFISPDFILSSTDALCGLVKAEGPVVKLIMKDHGSIVPAIVAHPSKPLLLTGCYSGFLKLCNYEEKTVVSSRQFQHAMIECCSYSPEGHYIGVGFTNGMIYILDSMTLTNKETDIHHYCSDCITHITFSNKSYYLAIADSGFAVCLLLRKGDVFKYIGRYRSHYQPISDLMFVEKFHSTNPILLSLGKDRRMVEYEMKGKFTDGLKLLSVDRVEQSAIPLCMTKYPTFTQEYFILIVNNEYKYKLFNAATKMCRQTILSPTCGSPLTKVIVLPTSDDIALNSKYMAFITSEKVGLQVLPIDGNRHTSTALIAHPDGVANIAASHDGKYLFTTSKKDASLHMWNINVSALEAQVKLGGEDLTPFYEMIEGGRDGEIFQDLEKYFYFSQLRGAGINSMEARPVASTIPVNEIPYVLRAMGYYPTEEELANIKNEVKFTNYVDTETFKEEINIGEFLKLLINHRPLVPPSTEQLQWAFDILATCEDQDGRVALTTEELLDILQTEGEHIKSDELCEILAQLSLPDTSETEMHKNKHLTREEMVRRICDTLPDLFTAPVFAAKFLGLLELEF